MKLLSLAIITCLRSAFILVFGILLPNQALSQFDVIQTNTMSLIHSLNALEDTIYAVGNDMLYKVGVLDSQAMSIIIPGNYAYNGSLNILSSQNFFIKSNGSISSFQILRSKNRGNVWTSLADTGLNAMLEFRAVNDSFLFGGGYSGEYFVSKDSGKSWSVDTLEGNMYVAGHCNSYSDSILLYCDFSSLAVSANSGSTWVSSSPYEGDGLDSWFVNDQILYVLASFGAEFTSSFSRTLNQGNSWQTISFGDKRRILAMDFSSASHGYAVGYDYTDSVSVIMSTQDSGKTWDTHYTEYDEVFRDVKIYDESTMFISGEHGLLLRVNVEALGVTPMSVNSSEVMVYPVPAREIQRLQLNGFPKGQMDIVLLDNQGRVLKNVYSGSHNESKLLLTVETKGLPSGIYFYRITANGMEKTVETVLGL